MPRTVPRGAAVYNSLKMYFPDGNFECVADRECYRDAIRRFAGDDAVNEWDALEEMSRSPEAIRLLLGVKVLHMDFHFHLRNPATVRQFVHAFDFLFDTLGFRLRWLRNGDGYPADQKVVDFLGTAGLPAGFCCYESVLVRE